jgi:transposase
MHVQKSCDPISFIRKGVNMPKLSQKSKDSIWSLFNKNFSVRDISKSLSIPKSSVHRCLKQMNLKCNNRAGRKKILTTHDVTFAVTQLSSNKADTVEKLTKTLSQTKGIKVSRQTLARELHNAGMRATVKKKKPAISAKNRKERLAFAKSHKDWTVEDWKRVVFSDETKINRFGSDGKKWSWRRDIEPLQPRSVKATVKGGGGSLMIWGCVTSQGVGYIAEIEGIMDQNLYLEILEGELADTIEYYEIEAEKMIFMQDNDPKHTAKKVQNYLKDQEFKVMNWPAQSPDLNPIENCWSYLKSKIYAHEKPANGLHELWERVEIEWEAISQDYLTKLYESMPKRMQACIRAKGYWTKY